MKEFWKLINIWGSYGQDFIVLFFLTHGVCLECDSVLLAWSFNLLHILLILVFVYPFILVYIELKTVHME